jgi:hypothetical protein
MKNQTSRLRFVLPAAVITSAVFLNAGCVKTANTSAAGSSERQPESQAAAPANTSNVATVPAETPAAASATSIDPPEKVVKDFYGFYLRDMASIDQKNRSKFARFLTKRFLKEAEAVDDFDPFLDAQDFDETFKDNYTASVISSNDQKALVALNLNGKTMKWKRKITLLKEDGSWKIDRVEESK